MAQKRMFSLQVVDTDQFLDLPASAQVLYFHLGMHGDDDGFVSSPRKIQRSIGCGEDDLRLLTEAGFLIPFPSGVIVIADWHVNNTLKNDRYRETVYQQEKASLRLEHNGRYTLVDSAEPEPPDARTETVRDTMEAPCPVPSGCMDAPDRNSLGSTVEPQPNVTQPNVTKPNITKPNITQPSQTLSADKPPGRGGVLSVESGERGVECGVWSVECGVRSGEWRYCIAFISRAGVAAPRLPPEDCEACLWQKAWALPRQCVLRRKAILFDTARPFSIIAGGDTSSPHSTLLTPHSSQGGGEGPLSHLR